MAEITEYERNQATEWGTFVAKEAIFIDGARAFNPGYPVPVSHVTRGIVSPDQVIPVADYVDETGTQAVAPVFPPGADAQPTAEDAAYAAGLNEGDR